MPTSSGDVRAFNSSSLRSRSSNFSPTNTVSNRNNHGHSNGNIRPRSSTPSTPCRSIKSSGQMLRSSMSPTGCHSSRNNKEVLSISGGGIKSRGKREVEKITVDPGTIEAEYIRNLQQQVYILELETKFLREQSKQNEGEVLSADLRNEQCRDLKKRNEDLHSELRRQSALVEASIADKNKYINELRDVEDKADSMKNELLGRIVSLEKELEELRSDLARHQNQTADLLREQDVNEKRIFEADAHCRTVDQELEEATYEAKQTKKAADTMHAEAMAIKTRIIELEERLVKSGTEFNLKKFEELEGENYELRMQIKRIEVVANQDKYMREKLNADIERMVVEHGHLKSENIALTEEVKKLNGGYSNKEFFHISPAGIAELQDYASRSTESINALQQRIKSIKQDMSDAQEELAVSKRELGISKYNGKLFQDELEQLRETYQKDRNENVSLRHEVSACREKLKEMNRTKEIHIAEMNDLLQTNTELKGTVNELTAMFHLNNGIKGLNLAQFRDLAKNMNVLMDSVEV